MESIEMLNKVDEIKNSLKRIERTIAEKPKTTNETRIGALNRISEAIMKIDRAMEENKEGNRVIYSSYFFSILSEIREILLGTGR